MELETQNLLSYEVRAFANSNYLSIDCFDFRFGWNNESDTWSRVINSGVSFLDSIELNDTVFFDVFFKQNDFFYIYNSEIGVIALVDTINDNTYYLANYE